ncbi:MAG: hypothetical protein LBB10_03320 [Bifidobacteriaceae bacterium]|nr:hypothetical protein [Bifidobacteriaceae bacterium]
MKVNALAITKKVTKNLKYKECIVNIVSKKMNGKIVAVAFSTVLTLTGVLFTSPASSYASNLGSSVVAFECTEWKNNNHGSTCIEKFKNPEGYNAGAEKWAGGGGTFDFTLVVGGGPIIGGGGIFHLTDGEFKSYFFKTGVFYGKCVHVNLRYVPNGTNWNSKDKCW